MELPSMEGETNSAKAVSGGDVGSRASIGKAMQAYMERAKEHQKFMKEQEEEFVFGRRHLANMMGKDPETFTQNDIDESIRYLFPAGLFEPKARPIMRPPTEIFPKQKSAEFDASGRPYHPFFYTARPNFFYLLHEMVGKLKKLNEAYSGAPLETPSTNSLSGSVWISKEELEGKLLEKINDEMYKEWVACMDRLASHPRVEKEVEFLKLYRKPLSTQNLQKTFPPVLLEPDGKRSVKVEVCQKKTALGTVVVKIPGTGVFDVNGKGLEYFSMMCARETMLFPLQLTGWLGTVDVFGTISGSGEVAQANALRWGMSMALAALGADTEKLRLAGLLTKDRRRKERNHIAHDGARAAFTWKKR